ncbi:MAG: PhzF family phenazine biosynthesis protein [Planctomycetota bacterium]|jgi:predicted PhzF superfamily epimerase YddE/YHI9
MRLLQIDAFADRPFTGNPAAVCLLEHAADEAWMQAVAAEMNLSETAFAVPRADGWDLRWFTPVCEVELCGHATLATAHALLEQGAEPPLTFHTRSGVLICRRAGDEIEMDFPSTPGEPCDSPDVGFEVVEAVRNGWDLLLRVPDERAVREVDADFRAIDARGIIVTAEGSEYDFVSRFFAPRVGVDEDPVTGSAHCTLAPFWAERLGRSGMRAYQASARGGEVGVRLDGDRVFLRGKAVTVLSGTLRSRPDGDARS